VAFASTVPNNNNNNTTKETTTMKTHPRHEEIVQTIKALPLWDDPKNFTESEISNCFTDDELVETFGWIEEKALTPKQAVQELRRWTRLRHSVRTDIENTAF
jgi:hypothetical protein